jgi:hypothetical protein
MLPEMYTKEDGRTRSLKERGSTHGQQDNHTQVTRSQISMKVKELWFGQTRVSMKAYGQMIFRMAKEFLRNRQVKSLIKTG